MVISREILTYFVVVFCVAYNAFFCFLWFSICLPFFRRFQDSTSSLEVDRFPTITVMISLLNEETVVESTIYKY